ncbi:MAG: hypothetical protein K8R89_06400 [Anaerolineae bacterium]|nr:hypothetical protein [Anaerolineae bacterium]
MLGGLPRRARTTPRRPYRLRRTAEHLARPGTIVAAITQPRKVPPT